MEEEFKCPVQEGEEYSLTCEGIGNKGDGIFKVERFVIVVPEAQQGKSYKIRVNKVLRNLAFGEIIE